jgi:uncharacterized membrane protein
MFEDRRIQAFVIAALCVLYIAVRLWGLSDSCLWFDEIFSVHAAEHSWGSLGWFVAQDLIHPPLFYAVLKIWIAIGGESVLWLRLLPILFSVVALVPFLLLGRELKFPMWTTALALFLLAVDGTMIKYAQLLRMHTMLMCLSLFSIWLFARYFNRGKGLIPLTVINIVLVYTHYYGWLVVAAEIVVVLIFQRIKWRGIATMSGVVFAAFLPWIYLVFQAARGGSDLGQNISWIQRPGVGEIAAFAIDLVEPFYFQASSDGPASIYRVSLPILLIILTSTVMFILKWRQQDEDEKNAVYFLAIFSFFPIVLVVLASWLMPNSIWGTRHLIVIAAPLAFLAATVLTKFNSGKLRTAAITLIVLFSIYAFYLQTIRAKPEYVWCAWEQVAEQIKSKEAERTPAKIYAFENLVAYHLWFALRDSEGFRVSAVKGVPNMAEDETYFLPRGFDAVERTDLPNINGDRMWLAFRTQKPGQEDFLLQTLKARGYTQCQMIPKRFGSTMVLLVEMSKEAGCTK